ncbi:MAG TPA: methyltransferase domain-containing protein [Segetibacter sp.]
MKEQVKRFLKQLHLYHPLQSFYRKSILLLLNAYYRIIFFRYKGEGFACNFCKASYKKFVPELPFKNIEAAIYSNDVIAGYGNNVYCPNCMSKNRERLVLAVIKEYVDIENRKILHFSPEKHLFEYLKKRAQMTTVDIMPGFYKSIDTSISYADATRLAFTDQSFDVIIANHIFEHIPEDQIAMKEMQRVLKTGGIAILQVPYSEKIATTIEEPFIKDPARQELLYGQKDHVRIYGLKDYVNRLETAGFKVRILSPEELTKYRSYATQERESVVLCYK